MNKNKQSQAHSALVKCEINVKILEQKCFSCRMAAVLNFCYNTLCLKKVPTF